MNAVKTGIRDAILVATKRQYGPSRYNKFNPTCGDANEWVTFWSENKEIDTCSTEG